MQRYPVYLGGEVSQTDQYLVKLVTTNAKDVQLSGNVCLTAPASQAPRRSHIAKTKSQKKAEKEDALRKAQLEVGLAPSINDRWRVTDPACPKKFSGIEEKSIEGQDTFMVMIFDKQTQSFQMIAPSFLHLTPEAAAVRFKTIEEAEAYQKRAIKRASTAETMEDEEETVFDLKTAALLGRPSAKNKGHVASELVADAGSRRGKKGKSSVKEEWEWKKVDDDEGMDDDDNIDDLEQEEEPMEELKTVKKSEQQTRMADLVRHKVGAEYDDDDEDELVAAARAGENEESDEEEDTDDEEETSVVATSSKANVALTGSREDRSKRPRPDDVDVERLEAKKARVPAQEGRGRDPSTLTPNDVVQVFVRASAGGDCYSVKMKGPEIVGHLLGSTKGYTDAEKQYVLSLIGRSCDRVPNEPKMFVLKRPQ